MAFPPPTPEPTTLSRLRLWARDLGFEDVGIAPVDLPHVASTLDQWMELGYAGDMEWLARHRDVRLDLRNRFPWAHSVIVVQKSYAGVKRSGGLSRSVSLYAQGADYHDLMLPQLQDLAKRAHGKSRWHAYVDTGPVLERQLAAAAGLGWLGKNTLLLNADAGSYFFLGVIVSELEIEGDARVDAGSCGSCNACQPACPTNAFVAPGVLDARRCISYLTIEHRGPIPRELRAAVGSWLFGCDLCQSACPFNGSANEHRAPFELLPSRLGEIEIAELLAMDEAAFREAFHGTALWRPRRVGLLRNALAVAANTERLDCLKPATYLLRDESEILREAASHALARLYTAWRMGAGWEKAPLMPDWPGVRASLAAAFELEQVEWVLEGMREDLASFG